MDPVDLTGESSQNSQSLIEQYSYLPCKSFESIHREENDGASEILSFEQCLSTSDYLHLKWRDEEEREAEEKLSLEYVRQLLEEEKRITEEETQEIKKRKRTDDNDDEVIAQLLQAEFDEEQEQEKKKKSKLNEVDESMHLENRDAIEYVCQSVLRTNDEDRRQVMEKLRCSEPDLERMISYLIACPKIIHFHPDKVMKYFVEDDQYRNQFETGTSSGTLSSSSRKLWEKNLFGSSYSDSSTGIRPKYGVLMYNGHDMNGCPSARTHYGDSYLVLQNVEDRVTYCYGDSGGHGSREHATDVLGYGCWLARILNTMPLVELQFLRRLADPSYVAPPPPPHPSSLDDARSRFRFGAAPHSSTERLGCYIEIQVHGSVLFNRDISMICLASRWKDIADIPQLAEEFCLRNPGVFLNYIDE